MNCTTLSPPDPIRSSRTRRISSRTAVASRFPQSLPQSLPAGLTPWYGCNRRPLRFHASTDCLQTEGSLHAPWALYKEDTATPAQEGEDFIELFNAAAEISA